MAVDVVPALNNAIKAKYQAGLMGNVRLKRIMYRIRDGTATLADMDGYAELLGESLSDAFSAVLTPEALPDGILYYNIANRTVKPFMKQNFDNINQVAGAVQAVMDEKKGIGLKAVNPDFPEARVKGLIDLLTGAKDFTQWLGEPVVNTTMSFADDFVKKNAEFRYSSGMDVRVIRETGFHETRRRSNKSEYTIPCEWCAQLAGSYDYASVRSGSDVFKRHESCRCRVTFQNGNRMQDVWSKRIWSADADTLKRRESVGTQLQFGKRS